MKLKLVLLVTLLFATVVNAQIYTPNGTIQGMSSNNNVGIGTSTPSAQLSLTKVSSILGDPQSISLYEDALANYGFAVNGAYGGLDFCANQAAAGTSFRWFGGSNKSTPKQLMVLLGNNQLGIGGSPIFGKLELFNTSYGTQAFSFYTNDGIINSRALIQHITTPTSQRVNFTSAFSSSSGNANWTFENGNVGMGELSPIVKLVVVDNNNTYSSHFSSNGQTNGIGLGTTLSNVPNIQGFNKTFTTPANISLQAAGGNVGIGTTTPNAKLSFNHTSSILGDPQTISLFESETANYGFAVNGAYGGLDFCANQAAASSIFRWYGGTDKSSPSLKMVMAKNGSLGIGSSPVFGKLELNNTSYGIQAFSFYTNDGTVNSRALIEHITTPTSQRVNFTSAFSSGSGNANWTFENGNVGIGTTNPTSKLTVAGNINSREVKVTVDAGADFVFENNYNLPSLDAVDQYIKENKHLPEIASADEMKKEGINLSEMTIKLLQKIEEMTLYMIEQNKKIIDLENRLEKVEKK